MSHGFTPIVLLGAIAFGALRLLGRRRKAVPAAAPGRASERTIGQSVSQAPQATRPTQPMIAAAKHVEPAVIQNTYLLSSYRLGRRTDATAALLDVISGPGLCTPRTDDPS